MAACLGFLINVGPKPDGTFPEPAICILTEVGDWLKRNGESIFNTDLQSYRLNLRTIV